MLSPIREARYQGRERGGTMTDTNRAVLIAGPTASGKSALALRLAEKLGGVIVNADSMQVYRDLRVLTARPSPDDEARVPHRLYGHVDAAVNYSTGQWLRDVGEVLGELASQGRSEERRVGKEGRSRWSPYH